MAALRDFVTDMYTWKLSSNDNYVVQMRNSHIMNIHFLLYEQHGFDLIFVFTNLPVLCYHSHLENSNEIL